MLITILVVTLAWSIIGGGFAIFDADNCFDRRPQWVWFVLYGPVLWCIVAAIGVKYSIYLLTRYVERKLRG